jgi:mannosyltransferase OCH1-like enzyme
MKRMMGLVSVRVLVRATLFLTWTICIYWIFYNYRRIYQSQINVCTNNTLTVPNTTVQEIPLIIHQSWKSCTVNYEAYSYISSWKTLNQNAVYKMWTDEEIDRFVITHYPKFWQFFKLLARPVMKSDIARIMIVATYGGVWADLDTINFVPITEWTKGYKGVRMIVGIEIDDPVNWFKSKFARSLQLTQWTFAAVPQHPILLSMLDSIYKDLKSMPRNPAGKIDVKDNMSVLDFAGPGMFTDYVFLYLKQIGYGWWRNWRNLSDNGTLVDNVLILPQIRWGNFQKIYKPGNWVLHKFLGSWK